MATVAYRHTALIAAPPERVYAIIADYREAHPAILPPEYFADLRVLEGGYGAGTRIRFAMLALGKRNEVEAVVTEPEPGRRLVERTTDGLVTEFLFEPADGGRATRLTFDTRYERAGVQGLIERLVAPMLLRKVYTAEMARIDARARLAADVSART